MTEQPPMMTLAARSKEGCEMLKFEKGDCKQLPFRSMGVDDSCFDVVGNSYATYSRKEGKAQVFDASNGKLIFEVVVEKAMHLVMSTKGTYLALWKAPELEGRKENLFIFKVGEKEAPPTTMWVPSWPCIQWSADESDTIIYSPFQGCMIFKDVNQPPALQFPGKWTDVSVSPTSPPVIVAWSIPNEKEREDVPTRIKVFRVPKVEKILLDYEIKVDAAKVLWNKKGTAALFKAELDSDSSGKSYYGEAALLLLQVQDKKVIIIPTGKTPIHDVQWTSNGKEFIVVFGKMPNNEATLFDEKGSVLHKFDVAPRNTVAFSPHNRFFFLSGFGNLPGDVVVYDREKLTSPNKGVIGRFSMNSVTQYAFSPCSRYILCATTHPRMTASNKIAIYKHNGEKVFDKAYGELYDASWRPLASRSFEMRDPSPGPVASAAAAAKPAPKAAAFRAAGARGSGLASAIKNQLSATKKTGYSNQHSSNRVGDSFTNWRGEDKEVAKAAKNTVPGALPVNLPVGADVQPEKPVKVKKEVQVEQLPVEDFKAKQYEDVEKALKAAKKKVQACGQLKNKDVSALLPDQKQKLAMFTSFKAEVKYLEGLVKAGVTSQ